MTLKVPQPIGDITLTVKEVSANSARCRELAETNQE